MHGINANYGNQNANNSSCSGYSNSTSSNSQSQSLSSSNTDSFDTVIYKSHAASGQMSNIGGAHGSNSSDSQYNSYNLRNNGTISSMDANFKHFQDAHEQMMLQESHFQQNVVQPSPSPQSQFKLKHNSLPSHIHYPFQTLQTRPSFEVLNTNHEVSSYQENFSPISRKNENFHPQTQEDLDKTKVFQSKSYSQIKDMIYTRFGVGANTNNGQVENNTHYQQQQQQQQNFNKNAISNNSAPSKNINTSFRRAIEKSGQKSNLRGSDGANLRYLPKGNVPHAQNGLPYNNNGLPYQNDAQFSMPQNMSPPQYAHNYNEHAQGQVFSSYEDKNYQVQKNESGERAQRALDQLLDFSPQKIGQNEKNEIILDMPPPLPKTKEPRPLPPNLNFSPGDYLVRENGDGSSEKILISSLKNLEIVEEIKKEGNLRIPPLVQSPSSSSECEIKKNGRGGSGHSYTTTDSGLGTVKLGKSPLSFMEESGTESRRDPVSPENDGEWVDIIEPEIRQILESGKLNKGASSSTQKTKLKGGVEQFKYLTQKKTSQNTNEESGTSSKQNFENSEIGLHRGIKMGLASPSAQKNSELTSDLRKSEESLDPSAQSTSFAKSKYSSNRLPPLTDLIRSNSSSGLKSTLPSTSRQQNLMNEKRKSATIGRRETSEGGNKAGKLTRNAMSQILYSLQDDGGDMSSNGRELDSIIDGHTENSSGDEEDEDDLSTTIDTTDAHAIRRQLKSLESMYTEVLKVLGKKNGNVPQRHPPPMDLRNLRRRPFGSMSSLPSSVSSRRFREPKSRFEDKKKVKDIKSINRRFQRLESHVVTLARSVAHLSSEMRTQHLMVQEMESIRNELSVLRGQVLKTNLQSQSAAAVAAANNANFQTNRLHSTKEDYWSSFRNALPSLTNPARVRKLTKFFGDEPPLIRIFLKKLGYEKYALHFEQEGIGIMELPYLTEERLQKMGIPMGPRLRILQEAHMCLKPISNNNHQNHDFIHHNGNNGNLSVYVV